jgi:hypothetical protein
MSLYYIKPGLVVGHITGDTGLYRWVPFTTARRPSRKCWPTPQAAIKGRVSGGKIIEARDVKHALLLADTLNKTPGTKQTEGWVEVISKSKSDRASSLPVLSMTDNGWIPAHAVPTGHYVSTTMDIVLILLAIPSTHKQPVMGWFFGGRINQYRADGSPSQAHPTHWRPLPELPKA